MTAPPPASTPAPAALALLSRLALAVARRRAYGEQHPMVAQADLSLATTLAEHVASQGPLVLAVANRDLLVNGEVMPAGNTSARDLATRLHLLGIGAVRFQRGLTPAAVTALVALLARPDTEDAEPAPFPDLPGIIVGRVDYAQLGLADEASMRAEGRKLWRTMAERLVERLGADHGGEFVRGAGGPRPDLSLDTLATLLQQVATDPRAAQEAFAALSELGDRIAMVPRTVRETVGQEMHALFSALDDEVLVAVLRAAPPSSRARFAAAVVDALPSSAMMRWLSVSAKAHERELSPPLIRLINKMAAPHPVLSAEVTDLSLRDTVLALVQGWILVEPNRDDHYELLDTLAEWSAHERARASTAAAAPPDPVSHEAIRLVQMACEIDFVSDDAMQAVRHLADHGYTPQLLEWAEQAPSAETRTLLRELSVTAKAVEYTLLATPFDAAAARNLLDAMPDGATPLLLEPLEHSDSRAARRLIYDRLHRAGGAAEAAIRYRLLQPLPWFLARNLLGLIRDIALTHPETAGAPTLSPEPLMLFLSHEHPQVRREAVRVLGQYSATRASALRRALSDPDDAVRQTAVDTILALQGVELPGAVSRRLLDVAEDETLDMGLRDKALRAAVSVCGPPGTMIGGHTEVRDWLLARCTRRGLLRNLKLAPLTPLVRSGLQLLAGRFAGHTEVAPVLALARREGALR